MASCTLPLKNIIRTFLLAFRPLLTFFTAYFEAFKRSKHTLYLACLCTASKNAIVTFPQAP